ncbi:GAF domain-containing protein [Aeromicrobium camelliae]|uniref:GAF domain-containing protein n=2 Tax=Aeromicrobium TaxID=2040 RepID=A0A3N6WUT7_9ACTN|nr:SpoIIE family protein phosphatase [Aeromicrobium camelliae]RQN08762.1 GAF domain-containing protein [Aeromicrobium camelliae]
MDSRVPPAAHTPAYAPVDLSTCEREPIHIPGAIQPHGVLLAVDDDATIVVASSNCAGAIGADHEELIGQPLERALGHAAAGAIRDALLADDLSEPLHVVLPGEPAHGDLLGVPVDLVVHRSGPRVVVEVERERVLSPHRVTYRSARAAMGRLNETQTIGELCDRLALEIRDLTGFDRVMVYRFDEDWNGEVVAEEKRDDLNSFRGLHYPASDIPAQARRLYTTNWTRLIADVGYTPVPLEPVLDPQTGSPLDLSHSVLRSVSPIHLEYLGNMGVTASMSVSMVRDGQLWGLVACHHYSGPHYVPYDVRSMAEFLGQTASQLIDERERSDARIEELIAQSVLSGITARLAGDAGYPLKALMNDERLLELVDADGAALWHDGELLTIGNVPDDLDLLKRIAAAVRTDDSPVDSSHQLGVLQPDLAERDDVPAGALVAQIGTATLMFVRPELVRIVEWGGDPRNKQIAESEGPDVRLSPRKSFEKWRGVVRGRSEPWRPWQLETADRLRQYLEAKLLRRSREQIAIAESLQRTLVLDEAPDVEGLSVLARYRPAQGSQLGGDWWDEFSLPDGRAAFVVGDVAGHGVGAATAMAQVRTALRAYLADGHSPASCLDRLDHLMGSLMPGQTATAVVVVFDPVARVVEVASAGHLPPLLVRDRSVNPIGATPRPLLGVGMGEAVSVVEQLHEGDILLVFTDGLVERRNVPLDESLAVLRKASAARPAGASLRSWVDALVNAVPGSLDDDMTLVALRVE